MPTVIIPPTDVSPYTGTGNQVLATNPTFPGIITVNGVGGVNTLKGIVVAGTDIAATDTAAFQVHNNVDDKPMVGFYRGGTLRSVLRLNTDNDFRLLSSNLSTPANLTVGNLTTSGVSYNDFAGALWLGTTAGYGTLNVGNVSGTGTATYSCLTIGDQSTPANATGLYMRGTSAVCGISTAGAPIAFFTGGPGTSEAARFFNNGNFGIGTTTDGGQKLQVNGDSGFLGHLEIPADKHIYMKQGNPLRWSSNGLSTGTVRADIYADSGGILYFRTNGTTQALNIDASQNATFAGGIIGMTQGNVDNISDDGVASFTPLYNRGFIVINNPDYSQNALIAYFKAGSSYLLYSITKSADVTLNNNTTLTGTTGTDGKLNIGYNNSIIYIENRLGGIGNFQRYALGGTN